MSSRAVVAAPGPFAAMRRLAGAVTGAVARAAGLGTRSLEGDAFGFTIVRGDQATQYQGSGREFRVLGFERNPVASACVRVVADIPGSVPLELYRKSDAGAETPVGPRHPGQQLLDAPRVGMSAHRLRLLTAAHLQGYGNALWVLERPGPTRAPTAIRLVHPENLQYVYLDAETLEPWVYQWRDRNGVTHKSTYADVVHFRDLTLADWIFGFPRFAAALLDIATDGEASQYVRQVVKNDGSPSLIFGLDAVVPKADAEAAEARWQEKRAVRGGRGRVAFMPGATQVHQIGFNLQELEFPELRAIAREDICAAAGVDPRMIGVGSAGNDAGLSGAQYFEARQRLYLQTGQPLLLAIESEMDLAFAPEWGDVYARFSPDGLAEITENKAETSTRVLAELSAGARTREEARKALGLPEKPKPTDTLVGPISRMEYPVALQFAHTEPTPPEEDPASGAPNAGPDDGAGGSGGGAGDGEDPPAAAAQSAGDDEPAGAAAAEGTRRDAPAAARAVAVRPLSRVLRRGAALTADQRAELWKHFDTRATASEGAYRRAALVLFRTEQGGVRATFAAVEAQAERSAGAPHRRDDGAAAPIVDDGIVTEALRRIAADYAPGGAYHRAWLDRYRALISETVRVAGGEVAAATGLDFTLENPRVQEAIRARANKLAGGVSDTTYRQIQAATAAGRAAGMGTAEIAGLIDETVFGTTAGRRATTIARTETVGAMNQGELLAARESGVLHAKEWLTQGDNRVRDTHAALDGVRVDLEAAFANGLHFPGDQSGDAGEVVNCRCTLLYHDEAAPA